MSFCDQLMRFCESHMRILENYPRVLAIAVYTYLRMIPDHRSTQFAALQQREIHFVLNLMRTKVIIEEKRHTHIHTHIYSTCVRVLCVSQCIYECGVHMPRIYIFTYIYMYNVCVYVCACVCTWAASLNMWVLLRYMYICLDVITQWPVCCMIGRDLVRILQDVATTIPEIAQFYQTIQDNPRSLSPHFQGKKKIYHSARRSPIDFGLPRNR